MALPLTTQIQPEGLVIRLLTPEETDVVAGGDGYGQASCGGSGGYTQTGGSYTQSGGTYAQAGGSYSMNCGTGPNADAGFGGGGGGTIFKIFRPNTQ